MVKQKIGRMVRLSEDRVRQLLRLHQSPEALARQSQAFWTRSIDDSNSLWWHARESHIFGDGDKWSAMGRRHTRLFDEFARAVALDRPVRRIVDWGCGGGANAVAFSPRCDELWGVDVSADALKEASRQVEAAGGLCAFHPVHISVPDPESALATIPAGEVDAFLSFYVFELLPSPEYGERVLRIAHQCLRPGGVAIIQIKYQTDSWTTRARRWAYTRSAANMTTYRIEAFWELVEKAGFEPRSVTLLPQPAEVPDRRYAYFMLSRP